MCNNHNRRDLYIFILFIYFHSYVLIFKRKYIRVILYSLNNNTNQTKTDKYFKNNAKYIILYKYFYIISIK